MPIYTVTQVSRYLKESLERDQLLKDLWLSGEISNLSQSIAGHYYFTIKDAQSQLRCVFFRPAPGAELLANGAAVLAHGRISLYETRGEIQLYVDLVQPEGMGELELEFQRLKAKLEAEGLFDPSRKRPLPAFPERIAVVTSPSGAVFHDIANVVGRRYPLAELVLAPTPVQGDGAANGIALALQALNVMADIDVVILARGGGSLEELWPFNEEQVARAIYGSKHPVISAVGHETDVTIADLVADKRAPTPSAAAEMVVPDQKELLSNINQWRKALDSELRERIGSQRQETRHLMSRLQALVPDIARQRQRVDDLTRSAIGLLRARLSLTREQLDGRFLLLASLNPRATLKRGYAVVQKDGHAVTRTSQVGSGDALRIHVIDGEIAAKVAKNGAAHRKEPNRRKKADSLTPRLL